MGMARNRFLLLLLWPLECFLLNLVKIGGGRGGGEKKRCEAEIEKIFPGIWVVKDYSI